MCESACVLYPSVPADMHEAARNASAGAANYGTVRAVAKLKGATLVQVFRPCPVEEKWGPRKSGGQLGDWNEVNKMTLLKIEGSAAVILPL